MAAAKHRAIDLFRHRALHQRKEEELTRRSRPSCRRGPCAPGAALDDPVGDDLLRLVFIACHPVCRRRRAPPSPCACSRPDHRRDRARIPRPGPTIAQRIVRAKRTLAEARVPFEVPRATELAARLSSVLEVVYLIFNEGYSATAATTGCGPSCAMRRCVWGASWPNSRRGNRRCTDWWR